MTKESVRIVSPKHSHDSKTHNKLDAEEPAKNAKIETILARNAILSLSDEISGHHFHYINYYWPGSRQAFPNQMKLQHVDKYYPFATDGPLFVDEIKAADNRDFEAKKEVMKKLGHRYLLITPNMSKLEAYEALA